MSINTGIFNIHVRERDGFSVPGSSTSSMTAGNVEISPSLSMS